MVQVVITKHKYPMHSNAATSARKQPTATYGHIVPTQMAAAVGVCDQVVPTPRILQPNWAPLVGASPMVRTCKEHVASGLPSPSMSAN